MSKQKIAIGPEMPDVPTMSADAAATSESASVAAPESADVVASVDSFGNTVETIVSVADLRGETRAQLAARVRETYTDVHGNTIETY